MTSGQKRRDELSDYNNNNNDSNNNNKFSLADGNVQHDEAQEVGLCDAQRLLECVDKLTQTVEIYVLSRLLVVALPDLVVHVDVVLRQTLLHVLRRLSRVE